jgi:TonB family protein
MNRPHPALRNAAVFLSLALLGCAATPGTPPAPDSVPGEGVALLRIYFVTLQPDAPMGKSHPPLNEFTSFGELPGGQDAKAQLRSLRARFTLPSLDFQFSDTTRISLGGDATLSMGYGEVVQVRVEKLTRTKKGSMEAEFSFKFGDREVFRHTLVVESGIPLLFAGHLDPSLAILSVATLEIRMFSPEQRKEMEEFSLMSRADRAAFAPPPPKQRDREPYIPGIGDVSMPKLISHDNAVYPDAARPERMDGQVIVNVTVDREGRATLPHILTSSSPIFEPSAMDSARTYRYEPAMKDGKPVAVTMTLVMLFKFSTRENAR